MYINPLFLLPVSISTTNFTNNTAFQGGALVVGNSNLTMDSCLFDSNSVTGEAGALRCVPAQQVGTGLLILVLCALLFPTQLVCQACGALFPAHAGFKPLTQGSRSTSQAALLPGTLQVLLVQCR